MSTLFRSRFVRRRVVASHRARLLLQSLEERAVPATFTVTSDQDSGTGSLRDRLTALGSSTDTDNTVNFDPLVFTSATTITVTSELPDISKNVLISGIDVGGASSITVSGGGTSRTFAMLTPNVHAKFEHITIADGVTTGSSGSAGSGGAVALQSTSASVTLDNVILRGHTNAFSLTGAAISAPTAYAGTITIANSLVTGNSSSPGCGAIYLSNTGNLIINKSTFTANTGSVGGAVGSLTGAVTITNSTFSNNIATALTAGGAIRGATNSTFLIENCLFTNNRASGSTGVGGAMTVSSGSATIRFSQFSNNTSGNTGGAIHFATPSAGNHLIENCTFMDNLSGFGGGTGAAGAVSIQGSNASFGLTINQSTFTRNTSNGTAGGGAIGHTSMSFLTINNSTIYNNTAAGSTTASSGGGIVRTSTGTLTLITTIVAGNRITGSGTGGVDVHSNTTMTLSGTDAHHNLIGSTTSGNITYSDVTTNKLGTSGSPINPLLGALQDNGGQFILPGGGHVLTMVPQAGGPTIDAGDPQTFTNDQRGTGFPRTNPTDIGAVERQLAVPPTVTGVVFGDGTNQRSLVKQLIVTFSEAVNFSPDVVSAFTLSRTGTGGTTGNVALSVIPTTGPANSVTITFTGGLTEFGSLVDGLYDFTISAGVVSGVGGALDGNNDTIPGGNYAVIGTTANRYFRYFGDSDGDGSLSQSPDFIEFRNAFGPPSTIFDFDDDGSVDQDDFIKFRNNFGGGP